MNKFVTRVIALALLASLTFANNWNVSWVPPTEYEDGSQLLEQDLDYYTLYCNNSPVATFDSIIGTTTAVLDTTGMAEGTYECYLTVTSISGLESAPSNVANFTIGPRTPLPPSGLTIQLQ